MSFNNYRSISKLSEKNSELSEWNSELTEKKCKVWVAIFLARFSEFSSDVLFYSVSSLSSEGGGQIIFPIEQKWQQDINQEKLPYIYWSKK